MIYRDRNNIFYNDYVFIVIILLLSVAVYNSLMQVHAVYFESLWQASYGVIEGKPHWIVFQNRLLGPYIFYLISKLGFSYPDALRIFILLTVVVQNLVLYYLLRKMDLSCREALIWVLLYSFVFLLVQDRWFYTWDSIDGIMFSLFAYGIVRSKSVRYFLIIFFIELINRESALFIALYLIIDSFYFEVKDRKFRLVSKAKMIIGGLLMVAGIVYTKAIREYLFISRSLDVPDVKLSIYGNHIYLVENLKDLFFDNLLTLRIENTAFILGSVFYLLYYLKSYSDAQFKALLIYCAMVANIMIFGLINETRLFIILLPFLVFLIVPREKNLLANSMVSK